MLPEDLLGTARKALKKWRWLVVSALAVVWITASCGLSALSTKPLCTWITSAIHGLLLLTETPQPVQTNNSKTENSFPQIILSSHRTCPISFGHYAAQTRTIKSGTSIAANTGTKIKDLTTISAYLITRSTINTYGKTTKASIPIPLENSKNIGLGGSQHVLNSPWTMQRTRQGTHLKKLPAKEPRNIIFDVTNMAKPIGLCRNIFACRLAAENLAA